MRGSKHTGIICAAISENGILCDKKDKPEHSTFWLLLSELISTRTGW